MHLDFSAMGPSGHVQASFEGEEVRMEFSQTSPGERGLMSTLIERAKKEKMTLHTVDKKGRMKPVEDESILEKIFQSRGELALKGTKESVAALAKVYVESEIAGERAVLEAQEDNTWKKLKPGEFKEKETKQVVKSVAPVRAG